MPSILEMAQGAIMRGGETLVKDAGYIPADKLTWVPMACAKSAITILGEIGAGNQMLAEMIRGEKADRERFQAAREAAEASGTLAPMAEFVMDGCKAACAAIATLSEADLGKNVTAPWGAEIPLAVAIFLPAQHMGYHDGQINYIQLLLGDDKFHWMEE